MKKEKLTRFLEKYLPTGAAPFCADLLLKHPFQLVVTPERKSKFGDFKPPHGHNDLPRISINGSLNPYAFLVTYLHEVAHHFTWMEFGQKVQPHGNEWKMAYRVLLERAIKKRFFPLEITNALTTHLESPKHSSCTDLQLFRSLSQYDTDRDTFVFVEDLPFNQLFQLKDGGLILKKGKRLRKYYLCESPKDGKKYRVNPIAKALALSEK